jgi:uncharacterized delta-60 repeat protein
MSARVDRPHRTSLRYALICSMAVLGVAPAFAAPGELDNTFSTDGRARVRLLDGTGNALTISLKAMAQQSDGKLVFAGTAQQYTAPSGDHFLVVRLNADGTLDTSFDGDGWALIDFDGSNSSDVAYAVLVQPDGKIVAVGQTTVFSPVYTSNIGLVRLNADGSPDIGFGTNGRVSFDAGGSGIEEARGVVRRSSDGRLVVAGTTDRNNEYDIIFAAFTSSGQPDTTFGIDGVRVVTFGEGSYEQAFALAQQSDGALVAAGVGPGSSVQTMAAVRVTTAGELDDTFDGDGRVIVDFGQVNAAANALAIQSNGRIVLAGYADIGGERQSALARLTATGGLDTDLGGSGTVTHDFGAEWNYEAAVGVAIQTDDSIVIGGDLYNQTNQTRDLFVARFAGNGSVDSTFGHQGLAVADFGTPGQSSLVEAYGLLRQSDGRLVVAGHDSANYSTENVARFDYAGGGSAGVLSFRATSSNPVEGSGALTINVRRTGGATGAVTTNVRLGAGSGQASAALGCDFDATLVPLSWADGDYADKEITVTILDDNWIENGDLFEVELYNPTGAVLAQSRHDVWIAWDGTDTATPTAGTVSIEATRTVNEGAGSVTLLVSRANGSQDCAVVPYQTMDGSGQFPATAGSDFVASSGVVQFNDGDTASKTIVIPIIDDAVGEADEQFGVQLSGNLIEFGGQYADVTILDNDGGFPGTIYVFGGDGTDQESDGAQGGPITLARIGGSNGQVSVTYTLTSGTATAGSDFVATSGTVTWLAGDTANKQIYVAILEDTLQEANETYVLTISNPTGGAELGDPTSWTQTIIDNDTQYPGELRCWLYTYSVIVEGSGAQALVAVNRENGRDGAVSVDYSTADGTATAGSDYTAASGTLNWGDQVGCEPAPGYQCSGDPLRLIQVPVTDDADPEPDETFSLNLSNPTGGATLSTSSSCQVTIYRSDALAGSLSISPPNQNVGETAGSATVTVTRSGGTQGAITIDFQTIGYGATPGVDFTETTGTLTWADGESGARTVTVPILDDAVLDPNEFLYVMFSNITGGAIWQDPRYNYAYIAIVDDESSAGTIVISGSVPVLESSGSANVYATRVNGTSGAVSVNYATVPGTAQPPGDYSTTSGTLAWAAGEAGTKSFTVPITNDTVMESTEELTVHFTVASGGATLPNADTTVTITDDDDPGDIAMSLATVSVSETATTLNLTVTRSTGATGAVSVDYATANGTATAGSDYTAASGTLLWANGETGPKIIPITILDDAIEESDEAFAVNLSNPTGNVRLQQASTTVTIQDNDANPGQLRFAVATRDVSEAAATVQIDVERFGGGLGAVSIQYATAAGTAVAGGDYVTTSGTLNWADGDRTTHSFSVPIVNDTINEVNESFTVTLSNPTGGAVLATPAVETVTITNDDPLNGVLGLEAASVTVTEGGSAMMQVTRTGGSGGPVQIDFATFDVTATAPDDYPVTSGTLTWGDGDTTSRTITVATVDDAVDERVETLYVRLSNIQGGAFTGRTETIVTIEDNDLGPTGTIRMGSPAISLIEASTVAQIQVLRTGGFSGTATVNFTTQDFTALAGSDYTATSGTLTWADGDTDPKLITVPLTNDTVDEPDETFRAVLSNATGASLDPAATDTVVTIFDDDLPLIPGTLSVIGPTAVDEFATGVTYNISRSGGVDGNVTVDYATVAGTATEGADYGARGGTLSWASGDGSPRSVTVPIVNDTVDEPNETFALSLSNPTGGATLGTASAATLIVDDDVSGPGFLGIVSNVGVFETVGNAIVGVQRTGGFDGAVSVNYTTAPDTALADQDYTAVSGTLSWAGGDGAVQYVTIPIVNDVAAEGTETFVVSLSGATGGATIGAGTGFVTIQDDDAPGVLAFTQLTQLVNEPDGQVALLVSRSNGNRGTVTIDYATVAGSATAGADYTTTAGTLTWNDGDTSNRTIAVPIINDTAVEFDETFTLSLSNATGGATVGADTATVTIVSDEVPSPGTVRMVAAAVTVDETAGTVTLSVERVSGADGAVAIDYATIAGSATTADFTPASGTVNWADGDTAAKTISIAIVNDTAFEEDEAFAVTLANPQGGAILANPSTTVTIHSDDAAVPGTLALQATSVSVNEAAGTIALSVTRTGGSDGAVSVAYATATGSATTADFTAASGTLSWANGDAAAKTITVPVTNDTLFEPDENFTVTLSGVTGGATLGAALATVTIVSEDPPQPGTIAMASLSALVGEAAGTVTITVNRTGGANGAVGVSYATADGTAGAADFTATSGTLSWADGDAAPKTFTVPIADDLIFEADETFTVSLSGATGGATLGAATTTVTIQNNDAAVPGTIRMAVAGVSVDETAGTVSLTVERVGGSDNPVGVSYATATGTAGAGDFTATSGTLSWTNGDATSRTITVPIANDTSFEPNETFAVTLSAVTGGATLGTPTTTVTIVSEDPPQPGTLAMAAATTSVAENLGSVAVRVNRTGGSDGAVSVGYATATGTAGAADFTATTGTLNWADHDAAAKIITVPIANDSLYEPNETFTVTLSGVTGDATLGAAVTTVTIVSEDAPQRGTIAMASGTASIGEDSGPVTITASRTGGTDGAVAVSYTTVAGSASAADFTAAAGTLNWADGESGTRSVAITITNDSLVEATEAFAVTLSNPTNDAALGAASTTVSILDDDILVAPGVLSLGQTTVAVDEAAGTVTLTVNRSDGLGGAVSVNYATANGSAVAGEDFQAASGTLTWANGNADPRTITLSLIDDTVVENDEAFTLTLSAPAGGATLGNSVATITVRSEDIPPDTTPEPFSFVDQSDLPPNAEVQSNAITVSGINAPAPISVTGGEYSVNGGAFTAAAGVVPNGATVRVRLTSSSSYSTTVSAVLSIGGVSDAFDVTTRPATTVTVVKAKSGGGAFGWPGALLLGMLLLPRRRRRAALAAAALAVGAVLAPVAHAADSGIYVGAGLGISDMSVDSADVAKQIESATGGSVTSVKLNEGGTSYLFRVGYAFNDVFALEAAYTDFGELDGTVTAEVLDVEAFADELAEVFPSNVHGPSLAARFSWPFADTWALRALAGVLWWESDVDAKIVSGGSGQFHASNDGTDLIWGAAVSWQPVERVELALEYSRAELPDAVSSVSLSVTWLTGWLSR